MIEPHCELALKSLSFFFILNRNASTKLPIAHFGGQLQQSSALAWRHLCQPYSREIYMPQNLIKIYCSFF